MNCGTEFCVSDGLRHYSECYTSNSSDLTSLTRDDALTDGLNLIPRWELIYMTFKYSEDCFVLRLKGEYIVKFETNEYHKLRQLAADYVPAALGREILQGQ